jgi:predicted  nucleic acid-binding Zn-ribbon protein
MASRSLFNFSWDESGLSKFLADVDQHLARHDEEVAELRRLLREKLSYSDLDRLRDELRRENDKRFSDLESQLSHTNASLEELQRHIRAMDGGIESTSQKVAQLESQFDSKLADVMRKLQAEIRAAEEKLLRAMPPDQSAQVTDLHNRLRTAEARIENTNATVRVVNENLKTTANAFASLNQTTAALDGTLGKTLSASAEKVRHDIALLFDAIGRLSTAPDHVTAPPPRPPDSIPPPRPPVDMDLTYLRPHPDGHAHWRDPPILPRLPSFAKPNTGVAYQYEMVPQLQGYLNAVHDRLIETADLYPARGEVQGIIDELTRQIGSIESDLADLRRLMSRFVSRAEFHEELRRLFERDVDASTAVGRVQCVACGRAAVQVIGAKTERDAGRFLGPAPSSVATGPKGMGQLFSAPDASDAVLVESPRSVRPFKASLNVRKRERG